MSRVRPFPPPRVAAIAAATLLGAPGVRAELPPDGTRITSSDYAIDLAQTPVLAGTRVTGLAGAFVAIGEGTDGSAQNPAAIAHRLPWSNSHFDLDVSLGLTFSSSIPDSDLFNSGKRVLAAEPGNESFVFANLAANVQFGRWGFGLATELQEYALRRSAGDRATQQDELLATFAITHATLGYAFHHGELLFGLGARAITLNVNNANAPSGGEQDLFEAVGAGYELGVLVRPNDTQFRAGAAFRTAVTANAAEGRKVLYEGDTENELVLPDRVTLPWDLNLGLAVQLGSRPFNPRWLDPAREFEAIRRYLEWRARERTRRRAQALRDARRTRADVNAAMRAVDAELETEALLDELHAERAERDLTRKLQQRYAGMDRFYVLVTSSLQVLGPVKDALGVESFIERTVQRSGHEASWSPRIGVETEAIPNWTRLRAGTYLEPSRFETNPRGARVHGTLGFEQRLFPWEVFGLLPEGSIFRVSGCIDVAQAYFTWGIAIGMWH